MYTNEILAATIIILIILLVYYNSNSNYKYTLPKIYRYKTADSPKIVILSGSHGNESGPGLYLNNVNTTNWLPGDYYIIPFVNIDAALLNIRSIKDDINRSWPSGTNINRYLAPIIKNADLVIDFHEAWGFHECQSESLGQTLYTNIPELLGDFLKNTALQLNNFTADQLCTKWTLIDKLPPLKGTLDEFCNNNEIPYILVEIAGQNDIQTLETRAAITSFILYKLFVDPDFN